MNKQRGKKKWKKRHDWILAAAVTLVHVWFVGCSIYFLFFCDLSFTARIYAILFGGPLGTCTIMSATYHLFLPHEQSPLVNAAVPRGGKSTPCPAEEATGGDLGAAFHDGDTDIGDPGDFGGFDFGF